MTHDASLGPPDDGGGPLPGSVSEQFIRCGKVQCHCRAGQPHGPYFYRVWRGEGWTVHKVYVKAAEVASVRARCAEYRAFDEELRGLRARRRSLSARLRVQAARSRRLRAALALARSGAGLVRRPRQRGA